MTIDLQHLNNQCVRELHHVESPFRLASQIPTNSFKTILDAVDGYQAIELDRESQPLTTFITPWGPYHFLRVPAGLIDSGDKYTSRYDQLIQHIPRKVNVWMIRYCMIPQFKRLSSTHLTIFTNAPHTVSCLMQRNSSFANKM